jgi:proline dehydrogenase
MLRTFFIKLSENQSIRHFAENSALGLRFSIRFVAGTQLSDVIRVTEKVNQSGASVSIDNLGENVTNTDEAKQSADCITRCSTISSRKLNASISLKLTHMGFDVSEDWHLRW